MSLGAFQLLEYQWSEGKFVINKPAATQPDASDNSMTEATSMPRGENKGTVKKCTGDSLNPRNTCFKTVNKKTGGLTLK